MLGGLVGGIGGIVASNRDRRDRMRAASKYKAGMEGLADDYGAYRQQLAPAKQQAATEQQMQQSGNMTKIMMMAATQPEPQGHLHLSLSPGPMSQVFPGLHG